MIHERFSYVAASVSPALQRIASSMVSQKKKYTSCVTILEELAEISFTKSRPVAIPGSGML
jgi:hypothetical protein